MNTKRRRGEDLKIDLIDDGLRDHRSFGLKTTYLLLFSSSCYPKTIGLSRSTRGKNAVASNRWSPLAPNRAPTSVPVCLRGHGPTQHRRRADTTSCSVPTQSSDRPGRL